MRNIENRSGSVPTFCLPPANPFCRRGGGFSEKPTGKIISPSVVPPLPYFRCCFFMFGCMVEIHSESSVYPLSVSRARARGFEKIEPGNTGESGRILFGEARGENAADFRIMYSRNGNTDLLRDFPQRLFRAQTIMSQPCHSVPFPNSCRIIYLPFNKKSNRKNKFLRFFFEKSGGGAEDLRKKS